MTEVIAEGIWCIVKVMKKHTLMIVSHAHARPSTSTSR